MDLYVERQCIDNMKGGDSKQFLLLFEANFANVYKYVARRVADKQEAEKIVRLTFLDALGQIQNTPSDASYLIWLYSLARPRVWDFIAKSSFPGQRGLISVSKSEKKVDEDTAEKVDKMMKKLTLEEREILRLKFFEEVADGDLITILGIEEGKLGSKIYRVLKRAHFLLFGDDQAKKKVYFGKMSGLFEKVRSLEDVEVSEVLKLSLKADFTNRIDRKNFAINGEVVKNEPVKKPAKDSFKTKEKPKGSNDPAKVFVEAVKEMKEEEEIERVKSQEKVERMEKAHDFIDRWKGVIILIPIILFICILIFVLIQLWDYMSASKRGYPNTCEVEVEFGGDVSDGVRRTIDGGITNRICDYFDVREMSLEYMDDESVHVEVDVESWFLEYRFVRKNNIWRIQKYARTPYSDQESGQI